MVLARFGCPGVPGLGERASTVPPYALGIRPVKRQASEELRRHAAALAGAVLRAGAARATRGLGTQFGEKPRHAPHPGEAARRSYRPCLERVVNSEWAGVDITDRVDQADHTASSAQVEPRQQGVAQRIEVEE